MCGFVGWINVNDEEGVELSVLKAMNQQLSHRGPDDEGYFLHGNVGLAHKRLSIIDTSQRGHQPLFNEDRSVVVVFNGEIYNYSELNEELLKAGHRIASFSDTETIVHAYEQWELDCLKHLDGMFSFALFDLRTRRMILARDRFGKKPLYYTLQNGVFLFASELKAFFPHPRFEKSLDIFSMSKYLAYEYVPTPHSIFTHCHKLPRASSLIIDTRNAAPVSTPARYWEVQYEPKLHIPEQDAVDELLRLFRLAVKKRLMSDVPLGVFLSGGVDSSSIVAMMAELLPGKDINTFTIGFSEQSFDESSYAAQVASYFGTEHHESVLDPATMLDLFPKIIEQLDEPFADVSIIPTSLLCQFSRQYVTVALGGDGSDELFAGYEPFSVRQLAAVFEIMPLSCLNLIGEVANSIPLSEKNRSLGFKLKHFFKGFRKPTKRNPELRNTIWLGSLYPELQQLLFSEGSPLNIAYQSLYQETFSHRKHSFAKHPVDKIVDNYINLYLHDDILVKVDRASMMHSLEVRAPFLDTALAEFACRLPPDMKIRGFRRKYLLKKAFENRLPRGIIARPKKGFNIPYGKWLKQPLREMLLDTFSEHNVHRNPLFNAQWIRNLIKEFLENHANTAKEIWTLFVFELWRQHHRL